MAEIISIDPITRIEGHLAIKIEIEADRVVQAFCSGEMFRGFEIILKGRDPLDAQQITQRICGICPVSHGMASVMAQEMAFKAVVPENARIARNIILAANYIQSHITHFYQLSAFDFVDITAITGYKGNDRTLLDFKAWVQARQSSDIGIAPFLPRYEGSYIEKAELNISAIKNYLEALKMRSLAHKLGAVFGGKLPHIATLIPGGITENVSARNIASCRSIIMEIKAFIDHAYLPDIIEIANALPEYFKLGRCLSNFLAYGAFQESSYTADTFFPRGVIINRAMTDFDIGRITEDVRYAHYASSSGSRIYQGDTKPHPEKSGAYSWVKAPRYDGHIMEVGPLARFMVAYQKEIPNKDANQIGIRGNFLEKLGKKPDDLISVIGRHAARALECKLIADRCAEWIEQLTPDKPVFSAFDIPSKGQGYGLTEAPRGALVHWIEIQNYKIANYQCVVPTTWNCSPRDDKGTPGPLEQALVGTPIKDKKNPLEAVRIVHSFDPCIACAIH